MHTRPLPLLSLVCSATLAAVGVAQTSWTTLNPTTVPAKRSEFDAARSGVGTTMVFGGQGATGYLNDTWNWDGKDWNQLAPATAPSVRGAHCMSYDFVRRRVVMFSGWNGGGYIGDTWEFDGANWSNLTPTMQPPARDWAAMAYDPRTLRTILFGGHDWQRTAGAFDDTWSWDGATWTQLAPTTSPPGMSGHRLVFDHNLGGVVLLGNAGGQAQLWQWTGTDWLQLKTTTTPTYTWMLAAAFDEARRRLVVYSSPDTWEFDGVDWQRRLTSGGPDVLHAPAFYDHVRQQIAVFAGAPAGNRATPIDLTRVYGADNPASYSAFGSGCAGAGGTPSLSGTPPWLGEGFTLTVNNLPTSGSTFCYLGLSKQRWGALSLPFDLAPLGASGCLLSTDPLLLVPMTNNGGTASFVATVPGSPSTLGAVFYNQAWAADATANSLGITVSNGGEGKLGAK